MINDEIREVESNTENAKDSLNELKETTEFALDSIERVGVFSKRTAGVGFGASLGILLGIVIASGSLLKIPAKYEDLLVLAMGIGGASVGDLLVKESGEEKARRLEVAASRIVDNPSLAGFMQNILEEHRLITRYNASKTAELDKEVRQQYLLYPATRPEVVVETNQQFPQIEQISIAPSEEESLDKP